MATERVVSFGFLNVVATPHPRGVYERLLRQAANTPVQFWGEQFAAISALRQIDDEPDLFLGRLVIWTEIDPDAPAINKERLTEANLSDLEFSPPANVGFNGRTFYWVLNQARHIITLELTNEAGKTVSPMRGARIFENLLSSDVLGINSEAVEVTVIPEEDALTHVLGIERLDKVEILVKIPNADDISAKRKKIMKELQDQKVKRQELVFTRESGTDGIDLNAKNTTYAQVASAGNGHVKTRGRQGDEVIERSTKEYPKIVRVVLDAGLTALGSIRAQAKRFRVPRGQP